LSPFTFKWNDAFYPKQRRFIHCSLKKRRRSTNGAVLNGTICVLLSLDARSRGRRRFFFLCFPPPFLSQNDADQPHLPKKNFPRVGGAAAQWSSQPCHSPVFAYKNRGQNKQKKRKEKKKQERRRKRGRSKSRIGIERREPGEEKTGEETVRTVIAGISTVTSSCVLPPPPPPATQWAIVGQPSSLSSSTSFLFFCVFFSTVHVACEQWRSPLFNGQAAPAQPKMVVSGLAQFKKRIPFLKL